MTEWLNEWYFCLYDGLFVSIIIFFHYFMRLQGAKIKSLLVLEAKIGKMGKKFTIVGG